MDRQLGEFEQMILLALLRLGDEAYGARIRHLLESTSGRPISLGSIYKTLQRLESKGYVTNRVGEPTAVRGGRRKKYYRVEANGAAALKRSLSALRKLLHGLDSQVESI